MAQLGLIWFPCKDTRNAREFLRDLFFAGAVLLVMMAFVSDGEGEGEGEGTLASISEQLQRNKCIRIRECR